LREREAGIVSVALQGMIVMKSKIIIVAAAAILVQAPALADPITGTVFNNQSYNQTDNNAPTGNPTFFFSVGADLLPPGYNSGTATTPTNTSLPLSPLGSSSVVYVSPGQTQQENQNAFTIGTYNITVTDGANPISVAVSNPQDLFANSIPYLTNFSSLAGLDPTKSFALTYNSFAPTAGSSQGFTFLTIYDATTGAVVYSDGFRDPNATSSVVGAGVLSANTAYSFEIDYSDRLHGVDAASGNNTELGYDIRTDGLFTTGVGAVPEPATWAMMLLGFCSLAFMAHHKRSTRFA
jgi:hypothetical protein